MTSDAIDTLLERYLTLVHEYTELRAQLNALQVGMYQNIARANFAAERGMRYGQDFYDQRMQASRRVEIETPDLNAFAVKRIGTKASLSQEPKPDAEEGAADGKDEESSTASVAKLKDPLRWFGLLTPMPLRQAQVQSVQAIEEVIPKLVSVNAEMAQVEIEVRRARKRRAKAEAAEKKVSDEREQQEKQQGQQQEQPELVA